MPVNNVSVKNRFARFARLLANKADKTAVDAALRTKAGKGAVNTALETKADKTAVDTALETKADKTAIPEAVADFRTATQITNQISTAIANFAAQVTTQISTAIADFRTAAQIATQIATAIDEHVNSSPALITSENIDITIFLQWHRVPNTDLSDISGLIGVQILRGPIYLFRKEDIEAFSTTHGSALSIEAENTAALLLYTVRTTDVRLYIAYDPTNHEVLICSNRTDAITDPMPITLWSIL